MPHAGQRYLRGLYSVTPAGSSNVADHGGTRTDADQGGSGTDAVKTSCPRRPGGNGAGSAVMSWLSLFRNSSRLPKGHVAPNRRLCGRSGATHLGAGRVRSIPRPSVPAGSLWQSRRRGGVDAEVDGGSGSRHRFGGRDRCAK